MTLKIMSFYERLRSGNAKTAQTSGFTLAHYVGVGDNRSRLARNRTRTIMDKTDGDLQRRAPRSSAADMAAFAVKRLGQKSPPALRRRIGSHSKCPLTQETTRARQRAISRELANLLRDLQAG